MVAQWLGETNKNMNSQKTKVRGKIVLKNNGSKTSVNKVKHEPSIKCRHKEVKNIPFQSSSDDSDCMLDLNIRCNRKDNKSMRSKYGGHKSIIQAAGNNKLHSRPRTFSQSEVCEQMTVPLDRGKPTLDNKTMQSKSAPLGLETNLEDSVDFIPVKLSPKPQKKRANHILNREKSKTFMGKSPRETDSGSCRATWDQLLKQESQNSNQQKNLRQSNSVETQRNSHSEHKLANPDPNKKKVSIANTNLARKCVQAEKVSNEKQLRETSESPEILTHPMPNNDPIESLDYLIKQLKEKIMKPSDTSNMEKIIIDMENALLKFNNGSPSPGSRFLFEEKSKSASNSKAGSSIGTSKSDLYEPTPKDRRVGASTPAQLQRGLEESCLFLQSLCIKQKEACSDHVRDKEQLTLQLAESRRLLAIARTKEKEYEVTIGELRLQLKDAECAHRKVQELDALVTRLKVDVQTLDSYKEAVKKLNSRLKEISCERETLQSKLHLKELEVEKLKILLEVKENLKPDSKTKKPVNPAEENILPEDLIDLVDGEKALLSSSLTSDLDRGALVCSSQASSSPGRSPSPSHSWTHISSIRPRPDDLERRVALMFEELKRKTSRVQPPELPKLEVISPDNSFWSETAS